MQLGGKQCRRCHREHFCVWWNWPSHYLLTVGECLNLRQPPTFLPTSPAQNSNSNLLLLRLHHGCFSASDGQGIIGNCSSTWRHDFSIGTQMISLFSRLFSVNLLLIQWQYDLWPDLFKQAFRSGERATFLTFLTSEHRKSVFMSDWNRMSPC